MVQADIPLPEIGLIAGTRGMLGAGIGLLFGDRLDSDRRRKFGWALLLGGIISTVPLALDVMRRRTMGEKPTPPVSGPGGRLPGGVSKTRVPEI